jgi:hypothetical protein
MGKIATAEREAHPALCTSVGKSTHGSGIGAAPAHASLFHATIDHDGDGPVDHAADGKMTIFLQGDIAIAAE